MSYQAPSSPVHCYSAFSNCLAVDKISTPVRHQGQSNVLYDKATDSHHLLPPLIQRIHHTENSVFAAPHVITDSGIDSFGQSKLVFADSSYQPCEIEVSATTTTLDEDHCVKCAARFQKKKKPYKGYLRYSLKSLNVSDPALELKGSFVCGACRKYFRIKNPRKYRRSGCAKQDHNIVKISHPTEAAVSKSVVNRSLEADAYYDSCSLLTDHSYTVGGRPPVLEESVKAHSTPKRASAGCRLKQLKRPPSSPLFRTPKRRHGTHKSKRPSSSRTAIKSEAVRLINASKYEKALHVMYKAPNSAVKKAFHIFIAKVIGGELNNFSKVPEKKTQFASRFTQDKLSSFNWQEAIDGAQRLMPMTVATATALFPNARQTARQVVVGRKGRKQ